MCRLPSIPELHAGQVNLHWATLADPQWDKVSNCISAWLALDEISRVHQFKFAKEARHYMLRRALLRKLIEQYTGVPASAIKFSYSRWGKPCLSNEHGLCFNLSHSEDIVLLAFCRTEIGVDIERSSAARIAGEAAHLFLSDSERREMTGVSKEARERACLRIWTRKEALLKGLGTGLVDEIRQVVVGGGSGPAFVSTAFLSSRGGEWAIYNVVPFYNVIGSVAVPRISRDDWTRKDLFVDPHHFGQ